MTRGITCSFGCGQTAISTSNSNRTAVGACREFLNRITPCVRNKVDYIRPAVGVFRVFAISACPYIIAGFGAFCILMLRNVVVRSNLRDFAFLDKVVMCNAAVFAIESNVTPFILTIKCFASRYAAGGGYFGYPLFVAAVIGTAVSCGGNYP